MSRDELMYEHNPNGINEVIEETGGSSYIALREVRWTADADFKYDIRRYYMRSDGTETAAKGISLTEDGVHTLSETLVANGFGNTESIVNSVYGREDFNESLAKAIASDYNGFCVELDRAYERVKEEEANKPVNAKDLLDEIL